MKKLVLIIGIAAALCACNGGTKKENNLPPNQLTEEQKKDGWQLLFDGTTTNGWHKYGNKKIGTAWKVADGAIYLDTTVKDMLPNGKPGWQIKDGGDIVSDSSYDNFHLKLEWKIAPNGNSGIIFYVHEDTAKYDYIWKTGPEMQVLDDAGHSDGKIAKHRAGDLYDLISCTDEAKKPLKPVGEWNLAEIKSNHGKLDFYLNGTNVASTTMWDDSWKKLIAGSKFNAFPGFGTYQSGHFALQDHGNMVSYRNVMVKKL
jgi:Domain of Unknown Function (DUF1080)